MSECSGLPRYEEGPLVVKLWGPQWTRAELLARVGRLDQVGGIVSGEQRRCRLDQVGGIAPTR